VAVGGASKLLVKRQFGKAQVKCRGIARICSGGVFEVKVNVGAWKKLRRKIRRMGQKSDTLLHPIINYLLLLTLFICTLALVGYTLFVTGEIRI
jgi:hypothetical protein